jgi:hypothetical protein
VGKGTVGRSSGAISYVDVDSVYSSLDYTQPPQVVVLDVRACQDASAVRGELDGSLAAAVAPSSSWTVSARFDRTGSRLVARGAVLDAHGITVADRALSSDGTECASLARGLGLWASLVLDEEVERARSTPKPPPEAVDDPLAGPPAARSTSLWPTTLPEEKRPPEADLFLRHSRTERTVELGADSFLMGGTGGGTVLGPSVYGVFEAQHGFFLRPALLVGHSIGGLSPSAEAAATFLASRFDACARLPGMYLDHRGMQLDLCVGADIGFSRVDADVALAGAATSSPSRTLPFFGLGPSFGLRGELGNNLSATIRGVTELSFLRDELTLAGGAHVSGDIFAGRAEVGLSWSLR